MKKGTKIDWEDSTFLQSVISECKSRVEVLGKLGYSPKSSTSRKDLNDAIKKFNLDISSFTHRTERWSVLPECIQDCHCIADVLIAVGLSDQGDNHKTAKRAIGDLGLDISHFKKQNGGNKSYLREYDNEVIFTKNSSVHRSTVKRRILRDNLIEYCCAICDNHGEWLDQQLVLELDHINGINNDHRIQNLRFLCPNCHSVTPTHRGKNGIFSERSAVW